MASAQDNSLLSPYRTFLLDLSSKLLIDDLEKLKFACKDVVPYGKTEEVTSGFKFFDLLEQNGIISPQNLIPLEKMMKAIGRADIALEVNQFVIGNEVPDGAEQDAGLRARVRDDSPFNDPAVLQDEGDKVVPDGFADDLEKKTCTLSVAMDQPLEGKLETRVETSHVSRGLLHSAPSTYSDPSTASRTTPMAHGDNIASTFSGIAVARLSSSKSRLSKPERQGTVQYVNFLALEGYSVQIVGGKHFNTPEGEFVELKSGTHYEIRLKNSHPYVNLTECRIKDPLAYARCKTH